MSKPRTFKNIPLKDWALLLCYLIISGVLIFHFIHPFKAERHFRNGYNFHVSHRYPYAIKELQKAVDYAPWETHYMTQLGRTYEAYADSLQNLNERQKVYEKAKDLYLHMITLDKLNPWFRNRLAVVYHKLSQLDPTKKALYEKLVHDNHFEASQLDVKNPLFQLNYAFYLHQDNRIEEAKKYYQSVIDKDDRIFEAFYNLADIYRNENRLDLALENYQKIYKMDPNFKNIETAIASIYIDKNEISKSLPYLINAQKKEPRNTNILRNLAGVQYQEKLWKDTVASYRRLFLIAPQFKAEYFQYYIQAMINDHQINNAKLAVKEALNEDPQNPGLQRVYKELSQPQNP